MIRGQQPLFHVMPSGFIRVLEVTTVDGNDKIIPSLQYCKVVYKAQNI